MYYLLSCCWTFINLNLIIATTYSAVTHDKNGRYRELIIDVLRTLVGWNGDFFPPGMWLSYLNCWDWSFGETEKLWNDNYLDSIQLAKLILGGSNELQSFDNNNKL